MPVSCPEPAASFVPRLSIIVVSFNTRDMTLDCLRTIAAAADGISHEVIVVDNASRDGSAEAIEAALPEVRLIAMTENVGFGRANNVGGRVARGARILLLNPDTLCPPGSIAALDRFADAEPAALLWGGRTVFPDGTLNPKSCWRDMSLWSLFCGVTGLSAVLPDSDLFNPEAYGGWRRDSVRRVEIITGCFLLIDAGLWRTLDGFDPQFFMYAEEADLCLRARMLGARPMVTPDAEIVHFGGASEPVLARKAARLFAAKITFMRKNWTPPARVLGQGLYSAFVMVRAAGYGLAGSATRRERWRAAGREWSALWHNRREWLGGYPPVTDASRDSLAT